ncbi:MAG: hypothetical protein JWQ38_3424 [Flavipsychrobacter sp.]|nr:hypothetical protein [Flavipsychrobacter sp.]
MFFVFLLYNKPYVKTNPVKFVMLLLLVPVALFQQYSCKRSVETRYIIDTVYQYHLNPNSTDPYLKYDLSKMNRMRSWHGHNDTSFPITFLNDTTIYVYGKALTYLPSYASDTSVLFGQSPDVNYIGRMYLVYNISLDTIKLHSVYYPSNRYASIYIDEVVYVSYN